MAKTWYIRNVFALLCAFAAGSLCMYWCYEYSLNEDSSLVNFKLALEIQLIKAQTQIEILSVQQVTAANYG